MPHTVSSLEEGLRTQQVTSHICFESRNSRRSAALQVDIPSSLNSNRIPELCIPPCLLAAVRLPTSQREEEGIAVVERGEVLSVARDLAPGPAVEEATDLSTKVLM